MEDRLPRRLVAILYADVAGYSRLTGADEETTHRTLSKHLDLIAGTIEAHHGQVMHYAGDAVLARFDAVVDALSSATTIQQQLLEQNKNLPDENKVDFRIGVNLGDVIEDRGDIYGDGVNIAARLESLADSGGICISDAVRSAVKKKLDLVYDDMGEQSLKNIEEPVRAYRVYIRAGTRPENAVIKTTSSNSTPEFTLPERPSVAIMPFKSLGSDADQDYIADGIRLGIQATLVQLSGLFLVNAPILNTYKDKDVTAAVVGTELAVQYVLEGSVQQAGDRIRATVQLTDVSSRQTIWAERYDRVLDDVFKLQDEITGEVISSLNIKLIDSEVNRVWFGKLTSPEAREFYYRGSSYLYQGNKIDNARAREMYEGLYRVQPESVIGPANISVTHWLDSFFGWTEPSDESMKQAAKWAQLAMKYEDNNGIGHAVFGHLMLLGGKYDEAVATCRQGVELRSSCPVAHGLLGLVLNYSGDSDAAVKSAKEALQLQKMYPAWMLNVLAAAYRDSGKVELSIPAAQESLKIDPIKNDARLILCSDYKLANYHEQAQEIANEIISDDPSFRLSTYAKSQPYRHSSQFDKIMGALREAGLPD